jgi:hypothetical protein
MVTTPAGPWNTPKLPAQGLLDAPLALVQFVLAAFQVPAPPPIWPSAVVPGPSQNWRERSSPATTRFTWPAADVWIS